VDISELFVFQLKAFYRRGERHCIIFLIWLHAMTLMFIDHRRLQSVVLNSRPIAVNVKRWGPLGRGDHFYLQKYVLA
jgi:hypothetical protein